MRNGVPGKEGLFVISVTSGSLADKTGVRVSQRTVSRFHKNTCSFVIKRGLHSQAQLVNLAKKDCVCISSTSKKHDTKSFFQGKRLLCMLYVDLTDSNNTSILNSTNNGALNRESWKPFHCAFFFFRR